MSWFSKVFGGSKDKEGGSSAAAAADESSPSAGEQLAASEADEVLAEDNRSLLLQLISKNGLTANMDLSKITLPTFILEPRSLLEKLSDIVVHPEFFCTLGDSDDPETRMINVVRWYLSAYHVRPKGTKKPYNPVLGETFRGEYQSASTAHKVQWVCQQVSHHPPVSAFFARSPSGDVALQGSFAPKSKFLGNSAASMGGGAFRLLLARHNEVYYCTWPNVYVRGVLFGTLLMELGGDVEITCPASGYSAVIKFETKGFFTGVHHRVKGTISKQLPAHPSSPGGSPSTSKSHLVPVANIDGLWTTKVDVIDAVTSPGANGPVLATFDKATQPPGTLSPHAPFDLAANDALPPTKRMYSSHVVWAALTDAIVKNDQARATEAKNLVEEYQRELRAQRKDLNETFTPSLFRQIDPSDIIAWEFTGPDAVAFPTR